MKQSITLLLLIFFAGTTLGQELKRKGSLGAVIRPADDGTGIELMKVLPNTTAEGAGLKDKDILLSVNGKPYNTIPALLAAIAEWRVDDPVELEILREGDMMMVKRGTVAGKPRETSDYGEVVYGHVDYDGGMLRSILELPSGVKNPPVVFIVPGIGCASMDYWYDDRDPIKKFTEDLMEKGIAVYRVEKPGMGDSYGTKDCLEMDYDYEVGAMAAALKTLKRTTTIDPEKVFLWGHSLGGVTAPVLGAKEPVAGIICWGSVTDSWYEYSLKLLRDQKIHQGVDFIEIEAGFRKKQPFIYDFFINKMTSEQLAEKYPEIYDEYFPKGNDLFYGLHHYKFVQQLNEVNFAEAWKKHEGKVLALYGEHDIHAIDSEWAKRTAQIVNTYHPGNGEWKIIPNTEHGMAKVSSMEENVRLRREGLMNMDYYDKHFNHELADLVDEWIRKALKS